MVTPHPRHLDKKDLTEAPTQVLNLANSVEDGFKRLRDDISGLADIANNYPYYKYNGIWTRDLQNIVRLFASLLLSSPPSPSLSDGFENLSSEYSA